MHVWLDVGEMLASLIVIFLSAEIFTNAVEHAGERAGLSEGATGSVFAAIATALPEAIVPIVAIVLAPGSATENEHVAVGAILGAPLMLSTLAFLLMAAAASAKFGVEHRLTPERSGLRRDMAFFVGAYGLAIFALYLPGEWTGVRSLAGIGLVMGYVVYLLLTFRASAGLVEDGHATESAETLWIARWGLPDNAATLGVQLAGGIGLLIGGAFWFVDGVKGASEVVGIPILILSLLVIPVATELPEKVNSIVWIRRGKDTLAFGNITGAMVFQSMLLPAIGILLSPWQASPALLSGILVTGTAGLWLLTVAHFSQLRIWHLLPNGLLYLLYVYAILP